MEFILFCLKCAGLLVCAYIGLHIIFWLFVTLMMLLGWLFRVLGIGDDYGNK